MVLEEDGQGGIKVAELKAGGAAEMSGVVSVGDMLISTSGYTWSKESSYGSTTVRSGEAKIILNVKGQARVEGFGVELGSRCRCCGHTAAQLRCCTP